MTCHIEYGILAGMIGIYQIRNKINGKVYVGRSVNIERRWYEERNGQVNSHLLRAFAKYGLDNFDFSVIEECPKQMLSERERYHIQRLRSNEKALGYNKTLGGEGGLLGLKHSESTRKKMSDAAKGAKNHNFGKPMHPNCYAILNTKKGEDHPCYGKKRPREIFKKRMKPVICIETGEWFDSGSAAARHMGLASGNIALSLNNQKRTFGGYHWKYADGSK